MKKSKLIIGLAAMLMLASCGGSSSSESSADDSSSSDSTSSSETPTSESTSEGGASDSASSSSELGYLTSWSAQDIADMHEAFSPMSDVTLPLPAGLTTAYETYTAGTGEDPYFAVTDTECGDLVQSYGNQLQNAGYIYAGYGYDTYGAVYYIFQICADDSLEAVNVYIMYYDDTIAEVPFFEIYAYYTEDGGTYFDSEFPYSRIEKELGIADASSKIPSFDTLSADGYMTYYYYDSYYGVDNLVVQGTYDEASSSASTLFNSYCTSLTNLGYTVVDYSDYGYDNYGVADNSTFGLEITIQVEEGYFVVFIYYYGSSSSGDDSGTTGGDSTAQEGTSKITITASSFSSSYAEDQTMTLNGIEFGYTNVMRSDDEIQFSNSSKRTGGSFWNTTSLGTINSIELIADVDQYYGMLTMYVSNEVITDVTGLTNVTPVATETGYVYNVEGDYSYFSLNAGATYASKNTSLIINYSL